MADDTTTDDASYGNATTAGGSGAGHDHVSARCQDGEHERCKGVCGPARVCSYPCFCPCHYRDMDVRGQGGD